jgi:hypothetical protein
MREGGHNKSGLDYIQNAINQHMKNYGVGNFNILIKEDNKLQNE